MRVAVAGTFGPIHDGHRALFEQALRFGDDGVLVALTSGTVSSTIDRTDVIEVHEAVREGSTTGELRARWRNNVGA